MTSNRKNVVLNLLIKDMYFTAPWGDTIRILNPTFFYFQSTILDRADAPPLLSSDFEYHNESSMGSNFCLLVRVRNF